MHQLLIYHIMASGSRRSGLILIISRSRYDEGPRQSFSGRYLLGVLRVHNKSGGAFSTYLAIGALPPYPQDPTQTSPHWVVSA